LAGSRGTFVLANKDTTLTATSPKSGPDTARSTGTPDRNSMLFNMHQLSVRSFASDLDQPSSIQEGNKSPSLAVDEDYIFEQEGEADNNNGDFSLLAEAPMIQKYSIDTAVWARAPGRL
jgi:hypothetical protein